MIVREQEEPSSRWGAFVLPLVELGEEITPASVAQLTPKMGTHSWPKAGLLLLCVSCWGDQGEICVSFTGVQEEASELLVAQRWKESDVWFIASLLLSAHQTHVIRVPVKTACQQDGWKRKKNCREIAKPTGAAVLTGCPHDPEAGF